MNKKQRITARQVSARKLIEAAELVFQASGMVDDAIALCGGGRRVFTHEEINLLRSISADLGGNTVLIASQAETCQKDILSTPGHELLADFMRTAHSIAEMWAKRIDNPTGPRKILFKHLDL